MRGRRDGSRRPRTRTRSGPPISSSRDARFSPEHAGANPVALESIVFDARLIEPTSRFIVDGLTARGPTVDLGLKAESGADGDGSSLKLELQAGPSATPDLIRLWPQFINPDVREWCAHNLHGGRLQGSLKANWSGADLDAMTHKRGLPRESLHGEFTTRDVGVDLLPGLPMMMTDVGTGSFTGHEFSLSGDRATMTLSPTRRVQATDLAFSVADLTPRAIIDATTHAHMTGTADSLADLLTREPLRRQVGLALDPATVKGQAEGDLALDLKLGKTARPDDTQFHATGALTNFQLEKFLADERLDSATATFEADRNMLKILGDGTVLGAATHIEVNRSAGEEGAATVTFALDAAARAKRGMNFSSWLTGTLPVKLKAPLSRTSAEVEIDLTPAAIDNPVPGVLKPAGKPGKATFVAKPAPEGPVLSNILIDLGVTTMRGTAQVGADGEIASATITQARIAASDDFRAEVANSSSLMKVSVRGAALDARVVVKSLLDGTSSAQAPAKDLDLDVNVANVMGANKQAIANMELTAFRRGGEMRLGSLRGRIGNGQVTATGSGAETQLTTTDAGALARFADLYARLEGGNQSHPAVKKRRQRRRGGPHEFRAARRAGLPPAGHRGTAARAGGRRRGRRSVACALSEDDGFVRALPGKAQDPGRRHLQPHHGAHHSGAARLRTQPDRRQRLVRSGLSGQYDADEDPARRAASQRRTE